MNRPKEVRWPDSSNAGKPGLPLGETPGGRRLEIPLTQLHRHVLVSGVSGCGKSSLLESMIRSLAESILAGHHWGLAVLDPIGEVFTWMQAYLSERALRQHLIEQAAPPALRTMLRQRRQTQHARTIFLDLSDPDCGGWRFNPLERQGGLSVAEAVGDLLRVIERIVGDLTEMRRLQTVLRAIFSVLVETGEATLRDAVDLLCLDCESLRDYLDRLEARQAEGRLRVHVRPSLVQVYLREFFASTSSRERRELVQSSLNLLSVFLADERAAVFLGSPRSNLDLERLVNGGGMCFIHVPAGIDLNTQRVLGAMLVNRIELICRRRPVPLVKAGHLPAFSLFVDEFQSFVSPEWSQTIAQMRNYRLNLILSYQFSLQRGLGDTPEGLALLRTVRANASTQIIMRQALEPDAKEAAEMLFRPEGLRLKREAIDTSVSLTRSNSHSHSASLTRSQSLALGHSESTSLTLALGEGRTASFSESQGVSRVESEGLSISVGKSWSRCVSKTAGVAVTQSEGTTEVEGVSQALGASRSEGNSTSTSQGDSSSAGTFEGQSLSLAMGPEAGLLPAGASSGHQGRTRGGSSSHSLSRSSSTAQSLSRAVSSVITSSRSLARSHSRGRTESRSTGLSLSTGGSETETRSRALARGLSQVESVCQALSRTLTRSIGQSQGRSITHTHGRAEAHSTGHTEGRSEGLTQTRRRELYSVQEEISLRAYELASLPARHAWVLQSGTEATAIRTLDVPQAFETRLGTLDGEALLRQWTAPPPASPEPTEPVHERLRRRHTAHTARPGHPPNRASDKEGARPR
ncbi:MAG: hypothetical protein H6712_24390 [Myxococcales bacterium]|nr:hypothetical protein [Myxococcales bacterium]